MGNDSDHGGTITGTELEDVSRFNTFRTMERLSTDGAEISFRGAGDISDRTFIIPAVVGVEEVVSFLIRTSDHIVALGDRVIDDLDDLSLGSDRGTKTGHHAGPAVYATLASKGYFPEEMLMTLNQGGTKLPSHCDMTKTPGIDFTGGSLGQGISAAVGIALGQKIKHQDTNTFAVVGDGESQEGEVWEAAETAAQWKLDNLIAFTDFNRLQLDGPTEDIVNMGIVEDKVIKNHFAAEYIFHKYKDDKTCGIIEEDTGFGIEKIAEPKGVICGIIPTTNPTSTAIFKSLISLKTRNAIIFSPHPRAKRCTCDAARVVRDAAVAAGAPQDIIAFIEEPSMEKTDYLMDTDGTACAFIAVADHIVQISEDRTRIFLQCGDVFRLRHADGDNT